MDLSQNTASIMDRTRTSPMETYLNIRPPIFQHKFKTSQYAQQYSNLDNSLVENQ